MIKKIMTGALVALLLIQFFRPEKNQSREPSTNDITAQYAVPEEVQEIMKKACNDCHSNNTQYPWYSNVQPVAWWIQDHVQEGKKELNFSTFASYKPKKQHHKLEEIVEQVKEEEMPLRSYTWMHRAAALTQQERVTLTRWADALRQQIAATHQLEEEATRQ